MAFSEFSLKAVTGLSPEAWFCVGAGYSREELKTLVLATGGGFVADAVTTVDEFAEKIYRNAHPGVLLRPLGPIARQEVLKILLGVPQISARMPELKRLRRQTSFFRRLDHAIQAGRMAFSHDEEADVFESRLQERFGENPIRAEVRALAQAYEAWLEAMGFVDAPLLIRKATEVLQNSGWPEGEYLPGRLIHFSVQEPESLEKSFWEALGRFVAVERFASPSAELSTEAPKSRWNWELWHTQDDACERLASFLSREADLSQHVVLMADVPAVRRSLKRALKDWKVPEADPRDPTRLEWDEAVKWALLPLQVVARDYERSQVVSWIAAGLVQGLEPIAGRDPIGGWIERISARGVRQGLRSYAGGELSSLYAALEKLSQRLGGKKTCAEMAEAHLKLIRENLKNAKDTGLSWVLPFFEAQWKQFVQEWEWLNLAETRAPLLYWVEKLNSRLSQAPAPVEQQRPRQGLRVYRLSQARLDLEQERSFTHLWILGLSSSWFSSGGAGDYWLGAREREVLSAEFSVRSGVQARSERMRALRSWVSGAESVSVLDSQYSADGKELESILPVLKELGEVPEAPVEMGSHPRWGASFGAIRPLPPQQVQLGPLPVVPGKSLPEFSATTLERYSRCSLQSLAFDRWRVRDAREPDCELWGDMRGNILHEAVKILLKSWTDDGGFTISCREALDRAWKMKPPQGWIRSPRVEAYMRSRMLLILENFREKEVEYRQRSGARVLSLDEDRLRMELDRFAVIGTPDRIDETDDGIFLMDYKTSSSLPNGTEMIELGYRLQLPFYALAAAKMGGKPVLGVQFIELSRRANRGSGIFFKRYNGKEPGKLTSVTARSKSLVQLEPEDAWHRLREHVVEQGEAYVSGKFAARPKKPDQECASCSVSDFCGYRRRVSDGLEGEVDG